MTDQPEHPYQKIFSFLRHHPMGILSTVAADGTPWGSAIYFVVDDAFNFYFVTRAETFKFQNIDVMPLAALTVADSTTQTTVQLTGSITHLPVQEYMDVFFDKFAKIRPAGEYSWTPPIEKLHKGTYMPLRLTPSRLQYADYSRHNLDPNAEYIEHIIG